MRSLFFQKYIKQNAHHNGKFAIDEDGIEVGTALYAQYAIDFLNKYDKTI